MSVKSPLKNFNETVKKFLVDLKSVFDSNDREIIRIETAFELTSVNARLFITPFQNNLLNNQQFVEHIMNDDAPFFINFDFNAIMDSEDETCSRMFNKFKQATIDNLGNDKLLKAIFNWFKVMIYYARLDQGIDMRNKTTSDAPANRNGPESDVTANA
jgi:hypothetical protein